MQHAIGTFITKQLMCETPLDTGGQVPTEATDDSDKTVVVLTGPDLYGATDGKWMVWKQRKE